MTDHTEQKPLTPKARARKPVLVGSPVRFPDGNDWMIPALPLGPTGDPLAETMEQLEDLEAELQLVEARQRNSFSDSLDDIRDSAGESRARARYQDAQKKIAKLERAVRARQFDFICLSLSLLYEVTVDDVAALESDLTTFRKVHKIVAGAPQIEELREAMEALKGEGSGN